MVLKSKALKRKQFEGWLDFMDGALGRFLMNLPAEIESRLDFSPQSLNVLESWILNKYPSTQAMTEPDQTITLDALARYIGETFRKVLGGYWDIQLDEPDLVYFSLPIITGFKGGLGYDCPITLATATANRRTGTYLYSVLQNVMSTGKP